MKNRTLIILCAIISAVSLASCGASEENINPVLSGVTTQETEQSEAETTVVQTEQSETEVSENITEAPETENTTAAETQISEAVSTAEVTLPVPASPAENIPVPEKVYANAYLEICKSYEASEGSGKMTYSLIDIDGDDIPELSAGYSSYWVSLYTYADGQVFNIMDHSGYGVSGNYGYDYIPGQNYIHYSSSAYAGLIRYETYLRVNDYHELEVTACIEAVYFDDANGNGSPDEDEYNAYLEEPRYYIDGTEISADEAGSYHKDGIREISGSMTYDEIVNALN